VYYRSIALEKTKYLFSDVYWKGFEEKYNFSLQFIADILSMNKADFIITSTYQEIAEPRIPWGSTKPTSSFRCRNSSR
jgi:sucrose synthase